jgi:putative endonuclease
MPTENYFVYLLHCDNDTYYVGYTTDLTRRYQEHLLGTAKCKYTRSFKPLKIAQAWQIKGNKSMAMQVERFIKKMNKKDKQKFILIPELLIKLFPCKPLKIISVSEV